MENSTKKSLPKFWSSVEVASGIISCLSVTLLLQRWLVIFKCILWKIPLESSGSIPFIINQDPGVDWKGKKTIIYICLKLPWWFQPELETNAINIFIPPPTLTLFHLWFEAITNLLLIIRITVNCHWEKIFHVYIGDTLATFWMFNETNLSI